MIERQCKVLGQEDASNTGTRTHPEVSAAQLAQLFAIFGKAWDIWLRFDLKLARQPLYPAGNVLCGPGMRIHWHQHGWGRRITFRIRTSSSGCRCRRGDRYRQAGRGHASIVAAAATVAWGCVWTGGGGFIWTGGGATTTAPSACLAWTQPCTWYIPRRLRLLRCIQCCLCRRCCLCCCCGSSRGCADTVWPGILVHGISRAQHWLLHAQEAIDCFYLQLTLTQNGHVGLPQVRVSKYKQRPGTIFLTSFEIVSRIAVIHADATRLWLHWGELREFRSPNQSRIWLRVKENWLENCWKSFNKPFNRSLNNGYLGSDKSSLLIVNVFAPHPHRFASNKLMISLKPAAINSWRSRQQKLSRSFFISSRRSLSLSIVTTGFAKSFRLCNLTLALLPSLCILLSPNISFASMTSRTHTQVFDRWSRRVWLIHTETYTNKQFRERVMEFPRHTQTA